MDKNKVKLLYHNCIKINTQGQITQFIIDFGTQKWYNTYTSIELFTMKELILNSIQLILAIILMVVVLLQQKGAGLGAAFGGSGNVYSTRRGVDKILHYITIGGSVLFFLVSIIRLVI